jgi:hypothetical protein
MSRHGLITPSQTCDVKPAQAVTCGCQDVKSADGQFAQSLEGFS